LTNITSYSRVTLETQLHHIYFSQSGSINDTNSQDEFPNETKIIVITFFEYNQSITSVEFCSLLSKRLSEKDWNVWSLRTTDEKW